MPYLILSDREAEIDRRELRDGVVLVVGRALDCDISVRDILLSRRHCKFEQQADHWIVKDLGSKNGTRIDAGHHLTEPHILLDGEIVRAGNMRICFRAGAFEPAPPGTTRKPRDARPADPIEALSGTVMGFQLADMEEDHNASGFPIPRPTANPGRTREPMPAESASSSWDDALTKPATAVPEPAIAMQAVAHRRPRRPAGAKLSIKPVMRSIPAAARSAPKPPAFPAATAKPESAPVVVAPEPRADLDEEPTIGRWQAIAYVLLAIGMFALSLSVIVMSWLKSVRVR